MPDIILRHSEVFKSMKESMVFLGELTRKELNRAISDGSVKGALVPVGSCEQHEDHLAMIHDSASVKEVAKRVALHFSPKLLVTPTVSIGSSEHHMDRGGAITVRPMVLIAYLYNICESLKRLGIPHVVVLNGHGGNKEKRLFQDFPEEHKKFEDLRVQFITYWETSLRERYFRHLEIERSAGHAGEFETSFAMAAFPHRIRTDDSNMRMPNYLALKKA